MELAKKYTADLYSQIQQQKFKDAAKLFGTEISQEEGIIMLNSINDLRGGIIDAVTDRVGTVVITSNGVISDVECTVELNCIYEKGKTFEVIVLKGKNFETLKVVGYEFALK
jgi:hypothetical protein